MAFQGSNWKTVVSWNVKYNLIKDPADEAGSFI